MQQELELVGRLMASIGASRTASYWGSADVGTRKTSSLDGCRVCEMTDSNISSITIRTTVKSRSLSVVLEMSLRYTRCLRRALPGSGNQKISTYSPTSSRAQFYICTQRHGCLILGSCTTFPFWTRLTLTMMGFRMLCVHCMLLSTSHQQPPIINPTPRCRLHASTMTLRSTNNSVYGTSCSSISAQRSWRSNTETPSPT